MKNAAFVLVALLAGLALGSWTGKADLRKARGEVADLKKQLSRRGAARAGGLDGITGMLKIPEAGEAAGRPSHPAAAEPTATAVVAATNPAAASATNADAHPYFHPGPGDDSRSIRERIDVAVDLWKTRSALARNSFVSNVATTSDMSVQFDVAMQAMNLRLSNSIRTWVDAIKEEKEITPETGVRMMNELSGALVWAYNDMDRFMPQDWRAKSGAKFQVLDFVNPEVALPLTEVEGTLRRQETPEEPGVASPGRRRFHP